MVASTAPLNERAMLVHLLIRQWTGQKFDKKATEVVATHTGAKEAAGRYYKKLIRSTPLHAYSLNADRARFLNYKLTLPWLDGGTRILPSSMYLDYMKRMREHRELAQQHAAEFVADYPEARRRAREELGDLYQSKQYPDPRTMEDRFSFDVNILPIPAASDFRVEVGKDADTIRKGIKSHVDQMAASAMEDIWTRVFNAVAKLAERLEGDKVFKATTITNVVELADLLPKLNITGDPKVEEMSKTLKERFGKLEAGTLRADEKLRAQTQQVAADIVKKTEDFLKAFQ